MRGLLLVRSYKPDSVHALSGMHWQCILSFDRSKDHAALPAMDAGHGLALM